MKLHELAKKMQEGAEFLLSRPDADLGPRVPELYLGWHYEKNDFINIVKALGSGKKIINGTDVIFETIHGMRFWLTVPRDKVCKMVTPAKPAVWDCEPLLSPEDEASLGQ